MIRRSAPVWVRALGCVALAALLAGCPFVPDAGSPATIQHTFSLAPQHAAACFARNAEHHSSALIADVGVPNTRGVVTVDVNVKNGVPYASVELRPAGRGSEGTLTLMVIAKSGIRQLVEALTHGC